MSNINTIINTAHSLYICIFVRLFVQFSNFEFPKKPYNTLYLIKHLQGL